MLPTTLSVDIQQEQHLRLPIRWHQICPSATRCDFCEAWFGCIASLSCKTAGLDMSCAPVLAARAI